MSLKLENWRKEELGRKEIIEKYPDVSPFIILKTDVQRRGIEFSQAAIDAIDPEVHQLLHVESPLNAKEFIDTPEGLLLRDGSSILVHYGINYGIRDAYVVDYWDGKFYLLDEDEVIEEIELWEKPNYYGKKTSRGTLMEEVVQSRPQRLSINPNLYCHFWGSPGNGCRFCCVGPSARFFRENPEKGLIHIEDVKETIQEAVKQRGRFTTICGCGGSILTGEELFDDEVQLYVDLFSGIREVLKTENIRTQMISSSFSKSQLQRIKEESGNMSYTSNLEVPTRELFDWICPGKAKFLGYEEWKRRLYDAVDVFGKGYVNTQIVAGADLVQPNGFKTEEESIEAILQLTEELAQHGVSVVANVWLVTNTIIFKNFYPPSLEYYVKLFRGINQIREAYDIDLHFDDYRRCGTHPSSDLCRI